MKKRTNLLDTLDGQLTVAEAYAMRPRKWVLYTAIVLILATLVGWSGSDVHFSGLHATGRTFSALVTTRYVHPSVRSQGACGIF